MEDPLLLWSRALRSMAVIVPLLVFIGGLIVGLEDLTWRSLLLPLGFSLPLWLASWLLGWKARRQK